LTSKYVAQIVAKIPDDPEHPEKFKQEEIHSEVFEGPMTKFQFRVRETKQIEGFRYNKAPVKMFERSNYKLNEYLQDAKVQTKLAESQTDTHFCLNDLIRGS